MNQQTPIIITTPGELEELITRVFAVHLRGTGTPVINDAKGKEIIDTAELCKRLKSSPSTIARYRKKGKIPFLLIGDSIRYDWNAVIIAIEK